MRGVGLASIDVAAVGDSLFVAGSEGVDVEPSPFSWSGRLGISDGAELELGAAETFVVGMASWNERAVSVAWCGAKLLQICVAVFEEGTSVSPEPRTLDPMVDGTKLWMTTLQVVGSGPFAFLYGEGPAEDSVYIGRIPIADSEASTVEMVELRDLVRGGPLPPEINSVASIDDGRARLTTNTNQVFDVDFTTGEVEEIDAVSPGQARGLAAGRAIVCGLGRHVFNLRLVDTASGFPDAIELSRASTSDPWKLQIEPAGGSGYGFVPIRCGVTDSSVWILASGQLFEVPFETRKATVVWDRHNKSLDTESDPQLLIGAGRVIAFSNSAVTIVE
jgi:hypothetical protein